jgi:hypothetical protein
MKKLFSFVEPVGTAPSKALHNFVMLFQCSFSKVEHAFLLAVHDCLFSILAATILFLDAVFSIHSLKVHPCCGGRRLT